MRKRNGRTKIILKNDQVLDPHYLVFRITINLQYSGKCETGKTVDTQINMIGYT